MKRTIFFLIGTFVFLLSQNGGASVLHDTEIAKGDEVLSLFSSNPIGVWDYTVLGAGSEYERGILFIRKENNDYFVEVQLTAGTLTGQDVQIEGNSIRFNIFIDGTERVSVVLQVVDDTISGNSYSSQGTFKIEGKRKSPQK